MSIASSYRLLDAFERTFRGTRYLHRRSNLGNLIAVDLYEDLVALDKSAKLVARVEERRNVVNIVGDLTGITSRRADGTFGERNPSEPAVPEAGYSVARGHLATIEVGAEVKVLMKAMIKQIDRVIGDLRKQVEEFRKGGSHALAVGIVGVNHAAQTTTYEGDRAHTTDGKRYKHPAQEAPKAIARLDQHGRGHFDEFLILNFRATNVDPYLFEWVNPTQTRREYGAILTRLSRKYDERF